MAKRMSEEEYLLDVSEKYMRGDIDLETYEKEKRRFMQEYHSAIHALGGFRTFTELTRAQRALVEAQRSFNEVQRLNEAQRLNTETLAEAQRSVNEAERELTEARTLFSLRSLEEWTWESRSRWEALVAERLSDERPSRFMHGTWTVSYLIDSDRPQPTLEELHRILADIEGQETGWPAWLLPAGMPGTQESVYERVVKLEDVVERENVIEAWFADKVRRRDNPALSDFWRASPTGKLFLLRGYQEDTQEEWRFGGSVYDGLNYIEQSEVQPGTRFDFTIPIWRVGECLLHATRFATALESKEAPVYVLVKWEGLLNRALMVWNPDRNEDMVEWLDGRRISQQDHVTSRIIVPADQIDDHLPELVSKLVRPLYAAFNLSDLPLRVIRQELSEMRNFSSRRRARR